MNDQLWEVVYETSLDDQEEFYDERLVGVFSTRQMAYAAVDAVRLLGTVDEDHTEWTVQPIELGADDEWESGFFDPSDDDE